MSDPNIVWLAPEGWDEGKILDKIYEMIQKSAGDYNHSLQPKTPDYQNKKVHMEVEIPLFTIKGDITVKGRRIYVFLDCSWVVRGQAESFLSNKLKEVFG